MDILSPKTIKELLSSHGVQLKKGLGQNFLISKRVLASIIKAAELQSDDTVLEVGPGLGTMTQELAKQVKKVVAVEKDSNMVSMLTETLGDTENITVVQADILKWSPESLPKDYKVVANLPYYISSPFIRRFLEIEHKPSSMTLLLQKEVAQRICAKPPRMHLLSVAVQIYAESVIKGTIGAGLFWPKPKVNSAIVHMTPHKETYTKEFLDVFFKILKAGFLHPRRQLINNLAEGLTLKKERVESWLSQNSILAEQRAETLGVKDWIQLTKTFRIEE